MNENKEIIEVVVRFDRIETLSGTYGQKGQEKRSWSHRVDYTGISGEKVKEVFLSKMKVIHNQWAAKDEKRLDLDQITCLEMFDLSEAKAVKAQSFGELKGKVSTLREYVKMSDKDIKTILVEKDGLTSEHADMIIRGENPFKVEKKGSQTVKVKRSENGQGISIKDIPGLDKALIDWGKAEKGTTENFVWTEESLNNVLKNANCPDKYAGMAKIYVRMNVNG